MRSGFEIRRPTVGRTVKCGLAVNSRVETANRPHMGSLGKKRAPVLVNPSQKGQREQAGGRLGRYGK
jgi:hypothetical protein